ncbi:MAG: TonB family protein, partial [Labilithrix sp.]|nr:TonB family protein [Labilithrix sp.]
MVRLASGRGLALAGLLALAATSVASPARADEPEAAPPAPIVPPRLLTSVAAPYPADAEGDAVVTLAVSVDAAGAVEDVRVLEGYEPFASAAIESVRGARFVPASRDGRAIAATVRFRVDFTKPAPEPAPAPEPEPEPEPADSSEAPSPRPAPR